MGLDADVIVVGAGPVGSTLAVMLGRAGRTVVLLDRATFPRDKACGEGLMPAGARVLRNLGIDLTAFPPLAGVTYRGPGTGCVAGGFGAGRCGHAVRRLSFDSLLAETAASTPGVQAIFGCAATAVHVAADRARVETDAGTIQAAAVVGADGHRSRIARWLGWDRPARPPHRYGLVGHLDAPAHGFDRVVVTLLDGCETYLAPTGRDQVLVAALGTKASLRRSGEHASDSYARWVSGAHPELAGCVRGDITGAGRFARRPVAVARGRAFLIGDAAGFVDPLTGEGISAGLVAAQRLAAMLTEDRPDPARSYRAWERGQWWRRRLMGRLALLLSGSPALARRALQGLAARPEALDRLLAVNDGSRSLRTLTPRDWAALGGI